MENLESPEKITEAPLNRRELLVSGGIAGFGLLGGGMFGKSGPNASSLMESHHSKSQFNVDGAIVNAAATAEALATTMYFYIINHHDSIYKVGLKNNAPDRAYFVAGYEQELNHYYYLLSAGAQPLAQTFYFPVGMFVDPQVTINTLVTLEDAFIAAYLIGVRDFSNAALRVIASQIGGVEAEHRVLARVVANDLGLTAVTGLSGMPESVVAPYGTANNLAYERPFTPALPDIARVVDALGPFVTPGSAGFESRAFRFEEAAEHAPSAGQPTVQLDFTAP